MLCAIHQPNFFPWMGYFDKIRRADVFVFLDDVDYPKSGSSMGSWCNRVRINVQGRPAWIRCPVRRAHGAQRIRDVVVDESRPWRAKLIRTLEMNYRRAPCFAQTMTFLQALLAPRDLTLAAFNIRVITAISAALGLGTRYVRQSDLRVRGTGTELLINLAGAVGADGYLCGGGAEGYQQDEMFRERGVTLIYQDFVHTAYGNPTIWMPGLSVIDYLMQIGIQAPSPASAR